MTALLLVSPLVAACTTVTPSPSLSSPHAPVILGTAIIAPEKVVPAVTEAVRLDPRSAVAIAAAATAGVPDQAPAIRAAVIREAPADAEGVVAATTVKRREPVVTRVEIPRPERMAMLVDNADRQSGDVQLAQQTGTPSFASRGMSRLGSGIARTLGSLGRSVLQFVHDMGGP